MTIFEARARVLDIARGELGYYEKASNSQLDDKTANKGSNNYTKYARDLDSLGYYNGRKQGHEWCDVWYDWLFVQAFGYPLGREMLYQPPKSTGAGTGYSAGFYKSHNAWYNSPEKGDQVFFKTKAGEICHTGIVEYVGDTWIQTIEGNANNMVGRHVYNKTDRSIAGYGRPNWALVANEPSPMPTPTPTPTPTGGKITVQTRLLKKGMTGTDVKSMQTLLIKYGFSCGASGADGDFGTNTDKAVRAFQKSKGLAVDGECGANTWNRLING